MVFFAIGYSVYLGALLTDLPMNKDLIAGEVFFMTALCMYLVVQYAYKTIHDIMHLDEFKQLANTDALTGMFSRRAILELVEDEFQKAQRFGFPLSVAMIDIDHFKKVNDTYTHLSGDVVLRELARVLHARLRKFDVLGRYGGDEFLCVLPGTASSGAMTTGERIRTRVTEIHFEIVSKDNLQVLDSDNKSDRDTLGITVSVGIATMHDGIATITDLVREADIALYQAKDDGRNCVRTVEPGN